MQAEIQQQKNTQTLEQKLEAYGKKEFYKGAFLTLKSANLVQQEDIDEYNDTTYDILKAQGLLMLFSVFWARLYEVGNFKMPTMNRWVYYGAVVGVPSLFHALYVSYYMNDIVYKYDQKYSNMYYEQYLKKVMLAKEKLNDGK